MGKERDCRVKHCLSNYVTSTTLETKQITAQLDISILQINELMNTKGSCPSILLPLFFDIAWHMNTRTYVSSYMPFSFIL
jgi:hypothetical protein